MTPGTDMLLAEELMLASIDPVRGRPVHSSETTIGTCLSGALVAELALTDLVLLEGKRFVTVSQAPAQGLLREAYEVLASGEGRRATDQLRRIDKRLGRVRSRVVDVLIEQGVLGRDKRGPLQVTAHPVLRPELRDEVVQRLRTAAAGDGPLEPRTAVLLALSGPARLLEVVADKPHTHAKKRIAEATELTPLAAVVKKVIAEAAAAASAGAVVATSASAASS
jgi:hypothetical protein